MRRLMMTGLIVCLGALAASGADDDLSKATYLRYCGACHGPGGKGDGVASSFMQPKPIDLTQIAKRNGGEFPYMRVLETIDGRRTVRVHGDPAMPVWGEVLGEGKAGTPGRQDVQGKLMQITDHIRSIQEK